MLSKYSDFYDEVRAHPAVACTPKGELKGLHLARFRSMQPVLEGEVEPPYDNPCPDPVSPAPPTITSVKLNICESWNTWEDFLADPNPTMGINIFEFGGIRFPINDEWRAAIIERHDKLEEPVERQVREFREDCEATGKKECTFTTTLTLPATRGTEVESAAPE